MIETVKKWSCFLSGKHFTIVTDQRSVPFMMYNHRRSKIKNDNIQSWRLELINFSYDICYRPGHYNVVANALSLADCNASFAPSLKKLQDDLCHLRITKLLYYVRFKKYAFLQRGSENNFFILQNLCLSKTTVGFLTLS